MQRVFVATVFLLFAVSGSVVFAQSVPAQEEKPVDIATPECRRQTEALKASGSDTVMLPVEVATKEGVKSFSNPCFKKKNIETAFGATCSMCENGITIWTGPLAEGLKVCGTTGKGQKVVCRQDVKAKGDTATGNTDTGSNAADGSAKGITAEELKDDTNAGRFSPQGEAFKDAANDVFDDRFLPERSPGAPEDAPTPESLSLAERAAALEENIAAAKEEISSATAAGATPEDLRPAQSALRSLEAQREALASRASDALRSLQTQLSDDPPATLNEYASQQKLRGDISALEQLVQDYGKQDNGQSAAAQDYEGYIKNLYENQPRPPLGGPYAPGAVQGISSAQTTQAEGIVGRLNGYTGPNEQKRGDTFLSREYSIAEAKKLIGKPVTTLASRYRDFGDAAQGSPITASGARIRSGDTGLLSAAHARLPFGSLVEVTNPANGQKAMVVINNRGPYQPGTGGRVIHKTRGIDLNPTSANAIGVRGVRPVQYKVVYVPPRYTYRVGRSDYLVGLTHAQSNKLLQVYR